MTKVTTPVYRVGDRLIESFEEAQIESMIELLKSAKCSLGGDVANDTDTAKHLIANRLHVIVILSESAPAVKKPRKDKGTKRTKKQEEAARSSLP